MEIVLCAAIAVLLCVAPLFYVMVKLFSRVETLEDMNNYLISKLQMLDASMKGDYPTARFAYQAMKMSTPSAGAPSDEAEEIVEEPPVDETQNTDATFTQVG